MGTPLHSHGPRAPGFLVDRRGFLKASGVTAAALAGGSSLLMGGCSTDYEAILGAGPRPEVLSVKEMAVLVALVSRVVGDEPGRPSALDTGVAGRIDRELRFHHSRLVSDIKAALLLVEHGGLMHLRLTRFTKLPPDEMDARLSEMANSSVELERQSFISLRLLSIFFHYTHESTWPHIGYVGPLVGKPNPPPADNRLR